MAAEWAAPARQEVAPVPMLIAGRWTTAAAGGTSSDVIEPATGRVIARLPLAGGADVDAAVAGATTAFAHWRAEPVSRRVAVLFRWRELIAAQAEPLARLISRENGKTIDEARGDLKRGLEVVEFACGAPSLAAGEAVPDLAGGLDALTWREPIGVCAGITPFNFPAMVPLWMVPVAIACGNAFILKPSEKTPLTAVRLAELLLEAGLPPGVLSIVHGGREAVEALCRHPGIAAVSFVGSTPVAEAVYRMAADTGKRVQAAGGAKNCLVVLPDADPEPTVRGILGAAFGCAGQRCMAGSVVLAVGSAGDVLRERLGTAIDAMRLGDPLGEAPIDMGPVIDRAAVERVHRGIAQGLGEGAEIVRDGRQGAPDRGTFVRPTLLDRVRPGMAVARTEWFGPLLCLGRPSSLDEALAWINGHEFGNGAVLFTGDGGAARRFAREVACGMVGVNVPVPAALAPHAFSGWNRSFCGDLHVQGREGFQFYTRQKLVLSRWDGAYRRTLGW